LIVQEESVFIYVPNAGPCNSYGRRAVVMHERCKI
jgi:hypothetical protein